MAQTAKAELANALAGSVPFLRLAGTALGGWLLAKNAWWPSRGLAERDGDPAFLEAKLITARFYADVILPPALARSGRSRPPAAPCSPCGKSSSKDPSKDRRIGDTLPQKAAAQRGRHAGKHHSGY